MRIPFDQGTPVPLRKLLNPHQVETAFEHGWSTFRSLRDQQNLSRGNIAIVVLSSTSWPQIQKAATAVKQAIDTALPGSFKEVDIP